MTPLRQKMINEMTLRRFAAKTQVAYLAAVAGLARYYNKSPEKIDKQMVQDYLLYLMTERKLSWNSCNVAVSGIRFFYTQRIWEGMCKDATSADMNNTRTIHAETGTVPNARA